jgi:glycosyltransferase involved in cell wall biosynthesis
MWRPFALRAAASLIRQHDIKTILVTAPPFSLLTTGVMLKRRFSGVRLISDFRDSWLDFYLSTFDFLQSDSMRRRAMDLESEVVRESDMVVTVTSSTRRELMERYPNQPENKFACVPNGYDSEVFAKFRPRPHGTGKIVVTLMGTVYQANSARYYFDALDRLPVELAERFETRFVGRVTDQERAYLEQPRRSQVKQFGFLPQAKAIELLEETDYLLVTMTDPCSMPGKMYEYLATGKPVLAFTPANGELSRLLMDTGAGWCVDPNDREAACRMLRLASSRIEEGHSTLKADWSLIKQFDRERLTGTYARLMQGCLAQGSSN